MEEKTCKYYIVPCHDILETECGNKILEDYTKVGLKTEWFEYCPFCSGKIKRLREAKT